MDGRVGVYYFEVNWKFVGGAGSIDHLSDASADSLYNVSLGNHAGENITPGSLSAGKYNVAMGVGALKSSANTTKTVAIGYQALGEVTVGIRNVALGYYSLKDNIYGSGNIGIGPEAIKSSTGGDNNIAIGQFSLKSISSSSSNTSLGASSLNGLTSGNSNIAIGYSSGTHQATGGSNIIIGTSVDVVDNNGSNQLNIGNLIYGTDVYNVGGKLGIGNGNVAPKSTLDVKGSMSLPVTIDPTTTTYNVLDTDYTVITNASSVVLPDPTGIDGRIYVIKKGAGSSTIVVSSNGAGVTIDASPTYTLNTAYQYVMVQATPGLWLIIGQN